MYPPFMQGCLHDLYLAITWLCVMSCRKLYIQFAIFSEGTQNAGKPLFKSQGIITQSWIEQFQQAIINLYQNPDKKKINPGSWQLIIDSY
jgi:hypothetical protein